MAFRFFEQLVHPFPDRQPRRAPASVLRFCRHHSRGLEPWLIAMSVLSMGIAIVEVALFEVLGQGVDLLSNTTPETIFAAGGRTLLWLMLGLLTAFPFMVALQSLILHQTLMGNFPMIVRWMAHRYLLRQSLGFFQDEFSGRVATRVMQTALAVRSVVLITLDILVYVAVYFLSVLFLLGSIDYRLAVPLFIWLLIYVFILKTILPRMQKVSETQADARSMMTGRIADSYTNIGTVKLFSHAQRESNYAREGMEEFLGTVHPQMRLVTWMETSITANNTLMLLTVSATALYLWFEAAISPGSIAAALALCLRINGISEWIMWEVSALFENVGTVRDGISTLSRDIDVEDHPEATPLEVRSGQLSFNNIVFAYTPQKPVFENLHLDIAPGEKIGLIGRSGAGKSTLVNLLLRFSDLQGGSITIDGQDISRVTQESLRANIGMVTQDTSLLHRSVRDNILYGRETASEEELRTAIQRARADEFIDNLEDHRGARGLDAQVGERGVKLSGGQRQRIAIARVMLKDAPILVLDEATSALDSEVEVAIQDSLYELMEGKTVLAIAHRLSTIAALDRLIVLDGGNIVETGSHAELIAKNGIYKRLWDYQSGGFLALD
ncbi:ABC transporter ATP-binding protein [Congregibacter litoralis]|uniref:ABC-type multidrug transport system, ATPase and permease component n=1 Tax=Congregibacter litoralis KT71 TaxID=314285 RepID=A4A9G8_9GAMM|nr:ABC transporter ATP-binding protein [Congregibacter litoralis]EAQ97135.1 ABC-type multidrug transport system, ATPase and permease component [Congregibacter litoralis KT71]